MCAEPCPICLCACQQGQKMEVRAKQDGLLGRKCNGRCRDHFLTLLNHETIRLYITYLLFLWTSAFWYKTERSSVGVSRYLWEDIISRCNLKALFGSLPWCQLLHTCLFYKERVNHIILCVLADAPTLLSWTDLVPIASCYAACFQNSNTLTLPAACKSTLVVQTKLVVKEDRCELEFIDFPLFPNIFSHIHIGLIHCSFFLIALQ